MMKGVCIALAITALSQCQGSPEGNATQLQQQQQGDYHKYMDKYGGYFQKYIDQYAGDNQKEAAGQDSPVDLFAAHLSGNQSGASAQARKAADEAKAEAAIKELHALAAKSGAVSRNRTLVHAAAEVIISKAFQDHADKHNRAQLNFEHRLQALNATLLAKANASDVEKDMLAAMRAEDNLSRVEAATVRAIKDGYHTARRAQKSQARVLEKRAKDATRQAKEMDSRLVRAQRAAGASEHDYESLQGSLEQKSERLEESAESAGEHAEREVERAFGRIEHEVEEQSDGFKNIAEKDRAARRQALRLAEQTVDDARREEHQRVAAAQAAARAAT